MMFLIGCLVYTQTGDRRTFPSRKPAPDRTLHYTVHFVPTQFKVRGYLGYRAAFQPYQYRHLKTACKSGALFRERNGHLIHPVRWALHTRDMHLQKSLVLAGIKIPQNPLAMVVYLRRLAADWTGYRYRAVMLYADGDLADGLVLDHGRNLPRRTNPDYITI